MNDSNLASKKQIVVNKELLTEFLLTEYDLIGNIHMEEVYKVINICLNKYANAYYSDWRELRAEVFSIILDRRGTFNPGLDAYNYIYTQSRNEIGNCLYRWKKINFIPEYPRSAEKGYDQGIEEADIPEPCKKYLPYLVGQENFTLKRIARKDVVDLLVWLMCKENKKKERLPEPLASEKNVASVMYKLLKVIVYNE